MLLSLEAVELSDSVTVCGTILRLKLYHVYRLPLLSLIAERLVAEYSEIGRWVRYRPNLRSLAAKLRRVKISPGCAASLQSCGGSFFASSAA